MGDTPAHNKLCGLKNGSSTDNPQCRLCNCTKDGLDNPYHAFSYTMADDFEDDAKSNRPKSKTAGFHDLRNNILRTLQYCDSTRGLNGALPPEALHFLLLGFFVYAIKSLALRKQVKVGTEDRANDGKKRPKTGPRNVFPDSQFHRVNETCRKVGKALARQADRNMPRTHFPSGYIPKAKNVKDKDQKSSKKCGHEMPGVVLTILAFLCMDGHQKHYSTVMGEQHFVLTAG